MNENNMERIKGQTEGIGHASELLSLMKTSIHKLWTTIWILIGVVFISNMIWIYVWNSYDYAVSSYDATGIYALIDSNGNILAQDISDEQMQAFYDWWEINGNSNDDIINKNEAN